MALAQLSPKSVASDPAYVNPQVRIDQRTSVPQNSQELQKTENTQKTDTVTLSRLALQKAGYEDAAAQKTNEKKLDKKAAEEKKERLSSMV